MTEILTAEPVIPTYTFGYAGNSYFNGRDGYVTRDHDGASIRIREDDGHLSVNVKDHRGSYDLSDLSDEAQAKAKDLNEVHGELSYPYHGATHMDRLYERVRESFWADADWLAQDYGFDECFSAGRMGGWCIIQDTKWLAENFTSEQWTRSHDLRAAELDAKYDADPDAFTAEDEQARDELEEFREQVEVRDRFLACAFDIVENIASLRTDLFAELIHEDHAELEERRQENTEHPFTD